MSSPYEEMRKLSTRELVKFLGAQALVFTAAGLAIWWVSGRDVDAFISFGTDEVLTGFGIGIGLIAIAGALFVGLPRISEKLVGMQAENFAFLERGLSMPVIVFFSLCAGVGEEALFRGGIQTLLSDYLPVWMAIAVSSALFAAVHFAKPPIAALIFGIGVAFGFIYWWTGSLLAVMIGHAVYDVFAFWYLQKELHRLDLFSKAHVQLDETNDAR